MPKVRRVLGVVSVEEAKRNRNCYHDRRKHSITAGEHCLVIRDPASGGKKNYCVECGNAILDAAADDLSRLRSDLNA
jgi:hypothetical protein